MNYKTVSSINVNDIVDLHDNLLTIQEVMEIYNIKFSNVYNDKFISSIQNKQEIYMDSDIIEWMGYDSEKCGKDRITKFLKSEFISDIDYKFMNYEQYLIWEENINYNLIVDYDVKVSAELLGTKKLDKNFNSSTNDILLPRCGGNKSGKIQNISLLNDVKVPAPPLGGKKLDKNFNSSTNDISLLHNGGKKLGKIQAYLISSSKNDMKKLDESQHVSTIEQRGLHNKKFIIVTIDCFKELCTLIGTANGKKIRKYFIEIETMFRLYDSYQIAYIKKQNEKTLNELNEAKKKILHLNTRIENNEKFKDQQIVYIAGSEQYKNNNNFKVGITTIENIKKRLSTYNTGRSKNDKYHYYFIVKLYNAKLAENIISNILHKYKDTKSKELYIVNFKILKHYVLEVCKFVNRISKMYNTNIDENKNNKQEIINNDDINYIEYTNDYKILEPEEHLNDPNYFICKALSDELNEYKNLYKNSQDELLNKQKQYNDLFLKFKTDKDEYIKLMLQLQTKNNTKTKEGTKNNAIIEDKTITKTNKQLINNKEIKPIETKADVESKAEIKYEIKNEAVKNKPNDIVVPEDKTCTKCNKKFTTNYLYIKHVTTITCVHHCPKNCGMVFYKLSKLNVHLNSKKPCNIKTLKCEACNVNIENIHNYNQHINSINCKANPNYKEKDNKYIFLLK